MELNFNKVTYDGELSDFSEDELRELVTEFETAQESNVAEFEQVAEATEDIDESTIEDFEDARDSLIAEITEAEAFDEVPLTEEQLTEEDFSGLQEWADFVAETDTDEPETDEDVDEGEFDDMGTKAPVDDEDSYDFVEDELAEIQGLNL